MHPTDYMNHYISSDMTEYERRIIMYEAMMLHSQEIGDAKNFVKYLDYVVTYRSKLR